MKLIEQFKSHLGYKILFQLDSIEDLEFIILIFKILDVLFPIKDEEEIENINEENKEFDISENDDDIEKIF